MASSHSVLSNSTANWHWKNKNVTKWAKDWFEQELPTISVDSVSITSVTDVDGDAELGQRKSKLITIFDMKVVLAWTGTTSDGTEVKGNVTIPEVSHEVLVDKLSDFAYEWTLSTSPSKEVDEIYRLARTKLPKALETKFAEFPGVLVETHGKDLTVIGSNDPSRSSTPSIAAAGAAAASSGTGTPGANPSAPKKSEAKPLNTKKITVDANFMASADDLFSILTDEKRIPTWSRAPAKSNPQAGTEYSLFGGGVKGKYVSLTPGKEIVQTWALSSPTWPSGHEATLTSTFDQGSDSTKLTLTLDGVPTGLDEETKRNIEGYYIHGLKSIGLGTVL